MKLLSMLVLVLLVAAATGFAQRHWANAEEYDLATQAGAERDPVQKLALLAEWETRYPQTEFHCERLVAFAMAYRKVDKPVEAFTAATQLLSLDPNDTEALSLIVVIGPSLPSPSEKQITATAEAATRLLNAPPTRPKPVTGSEPLTAPASSAAPAHDPEAERVSALLRKMRKNAPPLADPDVKRRQAAEAALEWVSRVKQ